MYKATEVVNFAQGELLMLGAFVAYTFIGFWGWQYWAGLVASMVVVAFLGFMIDAVILRRVLGQPQFAIVMLTIGLGFIFRAVATMIWGANSLVLPTPFFGQSLSLFGISVPANTMAMVVGALLLCTLLSLFFGATRIGIAMQATAQNQLAAYYMGIRVCGDCGSANYYPRPHCAECFGTNQSWKECSGFGHIYAVSVTRRGAEPYAIAFVTLEEGPRLLTNIVDCDLDALRIDQKVQLTFRELSGGLAPCFTPVEEQGGKS
ncbi:OB-fold domain-containing protein [Martelella soudanensis]|uniref:OB-fold domain-containing protein n=1 Tax=Martelella sp. NC20 TaxID=2740298 RepID=UPI002111DD73|nr:MULTISPECIES: OB-fold domain-containing protein [unclassified Martelella]